MKYVFLIEDDCQVRRFLKSILNNSGYEVWDASNGARVAEMYQRRRPDLVITGLAMAEKDGFELIGDLRRTDSTARFIAMSGGGSNFGAESFLTMARKLGAQQTLSKPFDQGEFLKTVRLGLESYNTSVTLALDHLAAA